MIIYLNHILIYIEDKSQDHVNVVSLMLNKLKKHGFFANLKKCQFYKDEVQFLSYVVSVQKMKIEDKRIKIKKNWPELKSIKEIQFFLSFANFY